MAVSAIILTKNEEKNIEECLKTLKWADEVIVIDDESTDKTVEIAKKNGAKVLEHSLNNDFSAQRNFGLEQTSGEWIFFIDADERVSPQLRAEITKTTQNNARAPFGGGGNGVNGYFVKRKDFIFGKKLGFGETSRVKLLRLAKKGIGEWKKPVHEVWEIRGVIGMLASPLLHFPHQTVSEFLEKINLYSTLRARELYNKGKKTNLLEILSYPIAKFLKNYFCLLGLLDGMPGFIIAILMSFHSFLVRSKLYLLWKQEGGWR